MRFLPDSAILGTLGHIKHATRKKKKGRAVSEVDAFVQYTDLTQDVRSFEELLIQAREHAKKKENVN
jgi:alpha-D-ribose 1-methylphosphonate 5-triphosphate synthase subunit PhnG